MSMVERSAKAMCRVSCQQESCVRVGGECFDWEVGVPEARAMIAAMREPSSEMAERGADWLHGTDAPSQPGDATLVWQAMIDAALAE